MCWSRIISHGMKCFAFRNSALGKAGIGLGARLLPCSFEADLIIDEVPVLPPEPRVDLCLAVHFATLLVASRRLVKAR